MGIGPYQGDQKNHDQKKQCRDGNVHTISAVSHGVIEMGRLHRVLLGITRGKDMVYYLVRGKVNEDIEEVLKKKVTEQSCITLKSFGKVPVWIYIEDGLGIRNL